MPNDTTPNDTTLARRGLFMKLGMLLNGVVAAALAVPIGRFMLSSITRARANGYLDWVSLGPVSHFPEGETRLATFRNPLVMPTDGKTWIRHAGCGTSAATNSRSSPSTARTWAVQSAGFRNPVCSCARVMAGHTIATARAHRGRPNAVYSSIRTKWRTV